MREYISIIVVFFILTTVLFARPFRVQQIPNGSVNGCANCHVNPAGGGTRNAFGKLVEKKFLNGGNVVWGPVLASYDADGDGISNGAELQDPQGLWSTGQPAPGNSSLVTAPGNFVQSPAVFVDILFNSFETHSAQKFELRVTDKLDLHEVKRLSLPSPSETFSFRLDGLLPDHSYFIDFYSDENGNGIYDSPPTDHAWRMELNNPANGDTISFTHNTDFTDIEWPGLLTISFSGMTPHNGQLLELRVIDDESDAEIGRKRVESVTSDFNMRIPGVKAGKEYTIQFYADLNNNGLYDAPPADHAWEIKFNNTTDDTVIQFTHNTSFTDINWKYNLILNLTGMTPHLGQQLSARIVKSENLEEVARTIINSLPSANFMLTIPGIEPEHNYLVDFFSDHSGNKLYDAPPTDHAWRDTISTAKGDFSFTFTHSTNFTDINWPNATSVDQEAGTAPEKFALLQNFPNPFNPATNIKFNLIADGFTSLIIYNILGKEVSTLLQENLSAGSYNFSWNAAGYESGVYFYKLQSGNFIEVKKMILLK